MELPPKTLLTNSSHKFCGTELKHTKCFFGLSRHFTTMSVAALLVAIVGVTSPLLHRTKKLFKVLLPVVKVSFLYAI
jgi:hypothetical protein